MWISRGILPRVLRWSELKHLCQKHWFNSVPFKWRVARQLKDPNMVTADLAVTNQLDFLRQYQLLMNKSPTLLGQLSQKTPFL
jgi:hypothetical protein